MHIYIYICIVICLLSINLHVRVCALMYVRMHVRMYVCENVRLYACMLVRTYICKHVSMHVYMSRMNTYIILYLGNLAASWRMCASVTRSPFCKSAGAD